MPVTRTSGQGRRKGSRNLATREVKDLAGKYGPAAIDRLAMLGGLRPPLPPAESEGAQVMAMRELLDRAYGKASQIVAGDKDKPLLIDFRWADAPAQKIAEETTKIIDATIEHDQDEAIEVVWQNGGADEGK